MLEQTFQGTSPGHGDQLQDPDPEPDVARTDDNHVIPLTDPEPQQGFQGTGPGHGDQ